MPGKKRPIVQAIAKIAVMNEIGIDISQQESKRLDRYLGEPFDFVITVCDDANDACPVFLGGGERKHWSIPDPSAVSGSESERLDAFRAARDELRGRIASELFC